MSRTTPHARPRNVDAVAAQIVIESEAVIRCMQTFLHAQPSSFRADHVGSLRTPEVLKARDDYRRGQITAQARRDVEDAAVRAVVRMQEDVGLQGVTDGEYRRASWHMDFIYQIGGITIAQDNLKVSFTTKRATSSSRRRRRCG